MEEPEDIMRDLLTSIKSGREEAIYESLIYLAVYSLLMFLAIYLLENTTIQMIIAIGIALGFIIFKLVVYLSNALELLILIRSHQIGLHVHDQ